MFGRQKKLLAQAERDHVAAIERKDRASEQFRHQRHQFLGEPLNLLYPFAAGALVCASQLKNEAKGIQRIPFLNLAKLAVGVWATTERIKKIRNDRAVSTKQKALR